MEVFFFTASKLGGVNNRFDFYAKPNGNIDSIAIYGSHLKGHLDNILEKQTIFGLPIEDAEIDRGGIENFIDIQIKSDYQISYHIALIKTNARKLPNTIMQSVKFQTMISSSRLKRQFLEQV